MISWNSSLLSFILVPHKGLTLKNEGMILRLLISFFIEDFFIEINLAKNMIE